MHIGVLTGGGDCPGLNAVIRAVTKALVNECGAQVTGIERGFLGLVERRVRPLGLREVSGILHLGGTILGTHNRADPFRYVGAGGVDRSAQVMDYVRELGLDAVVVIGGDGSMSIAHRFGQLGLPIVGVPKTIDNDLMHTERSFGFDSAVAVVTDAIERLETTAQSHGRVMIVETMGRYSGWIALEAGMAGAADVILLPERPYDLDAVVQRCREREAVQGYTIVCVAEGTHARGAGMTVQARLADSPDPLRLGGVGHLLREQLQQRLGSEVRSTQLGHLQRGGSPTAFDRVLATRFGYHAAQLVAQGRFGHMVALEGSCCTEVPLGDVAGRNRTVPPDHPLLQAARGLGICLG
ncbi:ATP-dependent 6-phosphofructokinase [Schlegelella sp. S2-27]|uniref:ATP-dependent 6-phosphofructokinase n=1 Tax=Caldimonas mangrovi TaxID=2944811 RepID=A0ABT0YHC8_9BURK|nr:ATP-dependent 6-phosphofructokinase [Caldimonas mangrovi]MCM5678132.1 ATP-dependent 6-phosphofructokinase [Caldimonas mangrovi]